MSEEEISRALTAFVMKHAACKPKGETMAEPIKPVGHDFEINLDGFGRGTVKMDGLELSCYGVKLEAAPGNHTMVTLKLGARSVNAKGAHGDGAHIHWKSESGPGDPEPLKNSAGETIGIVQSEVIAMTLTSGPPPDKKGREFLGAP